LRCPVIDPSLFEHLPPRRMDAAFYSVLRDNIEPAGPIKHASNVQ